MENRINQIAVLANGKKYVILKQALYQNKNYFLAAEITENEEDVTGEFTILEQVKRDEKDFLKVVTEKETLKMLIKYFETRE